MSTSSTLSSLPEERSTQTPGHLTRSSLRQLGVGLPPTPPLPPTRAPSRRVRQRGETPAVSPGPPPPPILPVPPAEQENPMAGPSGPTNPTPSAVTPEVTSSNGPAGQEEPMAGPSGPTNPTSSAVTPEVTSSNGPAGQEEPMAGPSAPSNANTTQGAQAPLPHPPPRPITPDTETHGVSDAVDRAHWSVVELIGHFNDASRVFGAHAAPAMHHHVPTNLPTVVLPRGGSSAGNVAHRANVPSHGGGGSAEGTGGSRYGGGWGVPPRGRVREREEDDKEDKDEQWWLTRWWNEKRK